MTYQLFEEKHHASIYQKYRFTPPDEVKNIILQYLDKKVSHGPMYCEYTYVIISTYRAICAYLVNKSVYFAKMCNIQNIENESCSSVNIVRRDSHMCWQWTWDVGQVRTPGHWHHTSRKWWALTSVSVNWRRPELCQAILTSHTGRRVGLDSVCVDIYLLFKK